MIAGFTVTHGTTGAFKERQHLCWPREEVWGRCGSIWVFRRCVEAKRWGTVGLLSTLDLVSRFCERPHSLEKHTLAQKHFAGDDDPNFFCSHLQTQRFYVEMCRNAHIDAFLHRWQSCCGTTCVMVTSWTRFYMSGWSYHPWWKH